jgi:hypothetical protein
VVVLESGDCVQVDDRIDAMSRQHVHGAVEVLEARFDENLRPVVGFEMAVADRDAHRVGAEIRKVRRV